MISEPPGVMSAQRQPPIHVTHKLKPVKIYEYRQGVFIADMGQIFAGVAGIKVNAPAGTKITLRYGEDLHADGRVLTFTVIVDHFYVTVKMMHVDIISKISASISFL